ncbi:MAG: hypothetical protein ACRC4M_02615, partial [Mycoplasma sp.]
QTVTIDRDLILDLFLNAYNGIESLNKISVDFVNKLKEQNMHKLAFEIEMIKSQHSFISKPTFSFEDKILKIMNESIKENKMEVIDTLELILNDNEDALNKLKLLKKRIII